MNVECTARVSNGSIVLTLCTSLKFYVLTCINLENFKNLSEGVTCVSLSLSAPAQLHIRTITIAHILTSAITAH